jgi:predicted double-glycine peptidase
MRRNYTSLVFTGVVLAFIFAAIPSMASAQASTTPIRDPDHIFAKSVCSWKQLKEANIVMQKRDYSCGAAALATVLRYFWGDNVTEDQILIVIEKILTPEEMKDRIKKGLAISDLRRAAVEMGYLSSIGTVTFQKLSESKVPLVVGISHNGYDHFVVYRGMDCDWVYVADPIRGNIRISYIDFVRQWQKNAILVVAKTDQEPPTTSPLSIHCYEVRLGELNKQLIRTQPEKIFTRPVP